MARVCHFEIHAAEPEKAIAFYHAVFGWQFKKWDGPMDYWMISTGAAPEPGIDGGLVRRQGPPPAAGQAVSSYVCTVAVTALDDTLAAVASAGGAVCVPKMPIPGVGWLAYATDTQGNIFGMMQADPNAA